MPKLFSSIIPDNAEANHKEKKERNFFIWPQLSLPRFQKKKPLPQKKLQNWNFTSSLNFFRKSSSTSTATASSNISNPNVSKEISNKSTYTIKDALYVLECIEDAFIYMDKMPSEDLEKNSANKDEKAYQHMKKIILNIKQVIKNKIDNQYTLDMYLHIINENQRNFNSNAVRELDKRLPVVEGKKSFLLAEFYLLYLQILAYTIIERGEEQTIAYQTGVALNYNLFGKKQNELSLEEQIFGIQTLKDRITPENISECVCAVKKILEENSFETHKKVNKALQILKVQSLTSLEYIMEHPPQIPFKSNAEKNEWLLQEIFTIENEKFLLVFLYPDSKIFEILKNSFAFKDDFVEDYFNGQKNDILKMIILGLVEEAKDEIYRDNATSPLYVSEWSQRRIDGIRSSVGYPNKEIEFENRSNNSSFMSISLASDSSDDDSTEEAKNSDMELESIVSDDNNSDAEKEIISSIRRVG